MTEGMWFHEDRMVSEEWGNGRGKEQKNDGVWGKK